MNPQSPHRVLIVDDNVAIHDDFRKILTQSHFENDLAIAEAAFLGDELAEESLVQFELDHAYQGEEAFDLVTNSVMESRPYGVAFVDMRMPPGWDGVETIERIWEVDSNLQVVICTAYSDYTWAEIAKRLGLNDQLLILKKPFDNVEVSQLAAAMTAKSRKERLRMSREQQIEQAICVGATQPDSWDLNAQLMLW